jgi:hypothetical protein
MSPTSSDARIAANRANAQKSTGPKTPEGKARSSINAFRHGLTGRVIILPEEDLEEYKVFSKELLASFAPETPLERQYAQTFVDTQWRLNRIRGIEDGMFALGHFEPTANIDVDHPQIHSALTASNVFRQDSQAFVNLSLYEQRLQRTLKESLRQLQELQAKRTAARQAALDAAVAIRNLHKMQHQPFNPVTDVIPHGFVFSPEEVELEARRQRRLADAKHAEKLGYDLKLYRQLPLKLAA